MRRNETGTPASPERGRRRRDDGPAVGAHDRGSALVDEVTDHIRAGIMGGRLPVGTRLPQATLAAELGLSRTPVREALRRLQAEGVVEIIPNRGAIVRGLTPRDIREAYQVRAELEGLAAELAAQWIKEDELRQLAEAAELFRTCARRTDDDGDPLTAEWAKANNMFHEIVQRAARNEQLRRTIVGLHRSFPRSLTGTALSRDRRLLEPNIAEHERILRAIEARDGAEARRAMTDHVRRSGELVAMQFEWPPDGAAA